MAWSIGSSEDLGHAVGINWLFNGYLMAWGSQIGISTK